MVYTGNLRRMRKAALIGTTAMVPYVGTRTRPRYRSGASQTMVTTKRKTRKNSNSFLSRLMAAQPAKHYLNSSTTGLAHNNLFTVVPTAGITQGTAVTNRIGDQIHLAAIKIKGFFETDTTAGAYSYRVQVGYTGEEYNLPTTLGSGLTLAEVFQPNTTAGWTVNGIVNAKAFTCIYDETIDINSQIAGVKDIKSYAFTVQLDKAFPYQGAGAVYGKNTNLVVLVSSSVSGGVTGSTSTGLTVLAYDLIFKDI